MAEHSKKVLVSIFSYGPARMRRFLVRQAGGGNSAVTNTLLPLAIRDHDPSVRLAALEVIATHRRPQDLALLSLALRDAQVAVRAAAAHALGQYQAIQVGTLLQGALRDPHPDVRMTAALALGQVPTLQFSPTLENALSDPNAQVRAAAAVSLGKVGSADARISLQAMVARDPDCRNRQIASQAMEAVQKRTVTLSKKKHQAGVDLIGVLVDPHRSKDERQRAKESLIRIGDESLIPKLDKALKASSDDQARVDIVEVLAALPPCQKLQITLLAYRHLVPSVRRRAIVALGDVGDEKAIYYLSEAAREGDQPGQLLTLEDSRLAREAIKKIRERVG